MKYAAMFACAAPFAALAGIVPGKDGPLVRSEDSKPVFLVSTTGKWLSFSDSDKRRKEMAKAAAEHPGYEWLYGEPNSIEKFYFNRPDGLCGNEDHGEMSAWYVFACLGFYPVNPASGEFVIGAPQVACAKLKVESGEFRVVAKNLSRENKYVKSVALNGKMLDGFILRYSDIMAGGELEFEMTGKADIPKGGLGK